MPDKGCQTNITFGNSHYTYKIIKCYRFYCDICGLYFENTIKKNHMQGHRKNLPKKIKMKVKMGENMGDPSSKLRTNFTTDSLTLTFGLLPSEDSFSE